ncbi:MAG: 50S ribosomal protein L13 [Candidatus Firestonebacteria bacterium]|nr:50S ribosomal protein L13 [Candidatus Firestonebacteria bacterium]
MKTFVAKKEEVKRNWYLIDAEGQVLGRLATLVANILRGKHKSIFTPHVDTGDFVVVVNASKVKLTGKKEIQKKYFRYSGYAGGIKEIQYKEMIEKFPERVVREAVSGMVPHNKLSRSILRKLKVYAGPEHLNQAQQPKPISL